MDKNLINKYKLEFDHWLAGGKLLLKWADEDPDCWVREDDVVSNSLWIHPILNIKHVIINDEYVEFRKALAEGKTVQIRSYIVAPPPVDPIEEVHYTWKDYTKAIDTSFGIENYRTKPNEPKFKIGDWVVISENPTTPFQINNVALNYGPAWFERISFWEPKEGELCYFWDSGSAVALVAPYKESSTNLHTTVYGQKFNVMQPFIGTPPAHVGSD